MNASHRQVTLKVQGMTCRSCAAHVERALSAVPGVESARVNLGAKTAVVDGSGLEARDLLQAVQDSSYTAMELSIA